MKFQPKFEVISPELYPEIHEKSLKVMEETGIVYQSEKARDLLKKAGAKVEGEIVHIPRSMVESCLKLCKSEVEWHSRNAAKSVVIGRDLVVQPNGGPVFCQDLDGGKREPVLTDYINYQKLCQHFDVVKVIGAHPIAPIDVDLWKQPLFMMQAALRNTDKPLMAISMEKERCDHQMNVLAIAMGANDLKLKPHSMTVGVNPLSPLRWSEETCDTIFAFGERSQNVTLLPDIMAGLTGPITLLEMVILQNIEILSGIVLGKTINPEMGLVYTAGSSVGYMKKGIYVTGSPEMMLIDVAGMQMGKQFYHLPVRTMCGMTDSKSVDIQSGFETMQNLMMGILGGADYIMECLGVLDSIMTTSFEKFIIDVEIIERCLRVKQGIQGVDLSTSIQEIQEIGHYGDYVSSEYTFEHFRERWLPRVSCWDSYQDWEVSDERDIVVRANRVYKEIVASAPDNLLSPDIDKDIAAYIEKAAKK